MRKINVLNFIYLVIFISSCSSSQKITKLTNSNAPTPIVQMNYYVVDSANAAFDILSPPEVYPGQKKKFIVNKSKIEVKSNIDTVALGIKLETSKKATSESDYLNIEDNSTYSNLFDGAKFTVTSKDISQFYNKKLSHNKFLKITAFDTKKNTQLMTGFFRIQRPLSFFNGFSSPVLFRVTGNAAGFNLNSISPSLGLNVVQYNFNSENFESITFDLLCTITSYPKNENSTDSYQYTLALGGVFDFGGYVQAGLSYSFLEEKSYVVIGFKPYLFSKLFGNSN